MHLYLAKRGFPFVQDTTLAFVLTPLCSWRPRESRPYKPQRRVGDGERQRVAPRRRRGLGARSREMHGEGEGWRLATGDGGRAVRESGDGDGSRSWASLNIFTILGMALRPCAQMVQSMVCLTHSGLDSRV